MMWVLKTWLWIIATIAVLIFVWDYLIPYIRTKLLLWTVSRTLRKIAKRTDDPETKEKLLEAARLTKETSKQEKLLDDENS